MCTRRMLGMGDIINPPHPFSIVLNRFWYFTQDLLSTIEPLENNRKWVWYVYKQHNNLVVGLVFEIQEIQTSALIILAIMLNLVQ